MSKVPAASALVVTAGLVVAVGLLPAAIHADAKPSPFSPVGTHAAVAQQHPSQLHFIDRVNPRASTDIDLGAPGFSAGNQQVFRDLVYMHGRLVGRVAGVGQIVALTKTTLTAQVVSTVSVPGATLTTQFAFTEVLADGPPSVLHEAITGGTGRYRSARGECVARFVNADDDQRVTCFVTTDG